MEVKYLTERPDDIQRAWKSPLGNRGGSLFRFVSKSGFMEYNACGCLTQVASGIRDACTPELTEAIRADSRIPHDPNLITVDNLHVFAEWQRRIDKELNR